VGSNYPAINSSDVSGLVIYCPSNSEQNKISFVLNNCENTIHLLKIKKLHLEQEKRALMQQLLKGKRRVKVNKDKFITEMA